MEVTTLATVLLWLIVLFNLGLTLATLRFLSKTGAFTKPALSKRPQEQGPLIRSSPPRLKLTALDGREHALEDPACEKDFVAFISASHAPSRQFMRGLLELDRHEALRSRTIFIYRGSEDDATVWADEFGIDHSSMVADLAGAATWKWDVHTPPFIVALDDGREVLDTGYASGLLQLRALFKHRFPEVVTSQSAR